jgi:ferredoxin
MGSLGSIWGQVVAVHAWLAVALVAGVTLIAPALIALVYGAGFRPDLALAFAVGLSAGFRVLRTPFSQLAVATGRTGDPARANLIRALALIPAAAFAAMGLPLAAIAAAAALGEAGATLRAWWLAAPTLGRVPLKEVRRMSADPITRMVARNLCTGCGACAGAFPSLIRMVDDPVNGRRPVVDASAEGHKAATAAQSLCAGAAADWTGLARTDAVDDDWGPVLAAWEGWASDDEIRHRGSSGGAVTALAAFALESGAADGVAHVAARAGDPRLNEAVISRDRASLLRGAGSRYAQASPAESLGPIARGTRARGLRRQALRRGLGKKGHARADADLAAKVPLTIAIFCAGAPNLVATGAFWTASVCRRTRRSLTCAIAARAGRG